jgi:hypothetical protein
MPTKKDGDETAGSDVRRRPTEAKIQSREILEAAGGRGGDTFKVASPYMSRLVRLVRKSNVAF